MNQHNLKGILPPYNEVSEEKQKFLVSIKDIILDAWEISKNGHLMVYIDEEKIIRQLTIEMKESSKQAEIATLIDEIPHHFKRLNKLILNVVGMEKIPLWLSELHNLQLLSIGNESLGKIDIEIFSSFPNLRSLYLKGSFFFIPETIKNLTGLKILSISSVPNLKFFPEAIGKLSTLTNLYLSKIQVRNLPDSIGQLENLSQLSIQEATLKNLPESFGHLQNLQKLTLHEVALEELPESIGDCYRLKELDIKDCNNLTTLPNSLGDLHNLESIHIYGCLNLKSIPDCIANLPRLKYVYLIENHKLDIPVWTQALLLKKLETFNVDGCKTKWMNP